MSASLVGSEMCIRDRPRMANSTNRRLRRVAPSLRGGARAKGQTQEALRPNCLLYTSDAADDM
eukprot:12140292-Alexandrium_andersonii.AAC.1